MRLTDSLEKKRASLARKTPFRRPSSRSVMAGRSSLMHTSIHLERRGAGTSEGKGLRQGIGQGGGIEAGKGQGKVKRGTAQGIAASSSSCAGTAHLPRALLLRLADVCEVLVRNHSLALSVHPRGVTHDAIARCVDVRVARRVDDLFAPDDAWLRAHMDRGEGENGRG